MPAVAESVLDTLSGCLPGAIGFCKLEERHFCVPSRKKIPFLPKVAVMTVFPYLTPQTGRENLCIYAQLVDYHEVVYKYLNEACKRLSAAYPDNCFLPLSDNSPLDEVTAAAEANLGVRGKNGLLITPDHGSFVFIGAILTDLAIPCKKRVPKGCFGCGRCIESCPTGALGGCDMNEKRCLSAVTQRKGKLTAAEIASVAEGGLAWGCDVCQTVCPMNNGAAYTTIPEFRSGIKKRLTVKDLDDLSHRAYGWRGREVLERNLKIIGSAPKTE